MLYYILLCAICLISFCYCNNSSILHNCLWTYTIRPIELKRNILCSTCSLIVWYIADTILYLIFCNKQAKGKITKSFIRDIWCHIWCRMVKYSPSTYKMRILRFILCLRNNIIQRRLHILTLCNFEYGCTATIDLYLLLVAYAF